MNVKTIEAEIRENLETLMLRSEYTFRVNANIVDDAELAFTGGEAYSLVLGEMLDTIEDADGTWMLANPEEPLPRIRHQADTNSEYKREVRKAGMVKDFRRKHTKCWKELGLRRDKRWGWHYDKKAMPVEEYDEAEDYKKQEWWKIQHSDDCTPPDLLGKMLEMKYADYEPDRYPECPGCDLCG